MTRLSEALERAQTSAGSPVAQPVSAPETRDVPADWQFQEVTQPVSAPEKGDVPADWQFQEDDKHPAPAAQAVLAPLAATERMAHPLAPSSPVITKPTAPAATAPVAKVPAAKTPAPIPSVVETEKLVIGDHNALLVEQFRRLAAVLHHAQVQRQIHKVMIASAVPAEGKSLTASNLALTLSRSYEKRVLLIDTDLRRPSLHTLFNVSNSIGLTTTLNDPRQGKLPVVQVQQNLWLLPAGKPDPNPTSLVTSEAMKQLLEEASSQFDWVILDTPPVGLMPDANLLAAMVDAAFVVVHAGHTPYPLVKKAVDAIGLERVLGVVLNRADRSAAAAAYDYNYYGYYAGDGDQASSSRKRYALG